MLLIKYQRICPFLLRRTIRYMEVVGSRGRRNGVLGQVGERNHAFL